MGTRRRIVVSGLDAPVRSMVNECLPSDHFDIEELDEDAGAASTSHADLVIFCAPKDLEQTQALCATLRSRVVGECPVALLRRSVRLPWHQGASWQRRAEYDHYAV